MSEKAPTLERPHQTPESPGQDDRKRHDYADEDTKELETMGDNYDPPVNNTLSLGEVLDLANELDDGGVIDFRDKGNGQGNPDGS